MNRARAHECVREVQARGDVGSRGAHGDVTPFASDLAARSPARIPPERVESRIGAHPRLGVRLGISQRLRDAGVLLGEERVPSRGGGFDRHHGGRVRLAR